MKLLEKIKTITSNDIMDTVAYTFVGSIILGFAILLLLSLFYIPLFFVFLSIFLTCGHFIGKYIVDREMNG